MRLTCGGGMPFNWNGPGKVINPTDVHGRPQVPIRRQSCRSSQAHCEPNTHDRILRSDAAARRDKCRAPCSRILTMLNSGLARPPNTDASLSLLWSSRPKTGVAHQNGRPFRVSQIHGNALRLIQAKRMGKPLRFPAARLTLFSVDGAVSHRQNRHLQALYSPN